jgi:hypothetical protein
VSTIENMMEEASTKAPDAECAAAIATRVTGSGAAAARRFATGARHYLFEIEFADQPPVVVRIGRASSAAEMVGALYLSALLRPRGVPLPAILAADTAAEPPWLVLERLPGGDLGAVSSRLTAEQLDRIAVRVARPKRSPLKRVPWGATAMRCGRKRRPMPRGRMCWRLTSLPMCLGRGPAWVPNSASR